MVLARALVISVTGEGGAAVIAASLWRLPGHLLEGALLGAALGRGRPIEVLGAVSGLVLTAFNIAAAHHEALTGELPGQAALHYVSSVSAVSASFETKDLALDALLFALSAGALVWMARRLERAWTEGEASPRWRVACLLGALALGVPWVLGVGPWGQSPLRHFVASTWTGEPRGPTPNAPLGGLQADAQSLQAALGHPEPFASGHPDHPLCADSPSRVQGPAPKAPRSVILLVLESVGVAELEAKVDGQWLMPSLREIAGAGVFFDNIRAAGTQSCQALPAIFAGQVTQTSEPILWHKPMTGFEGLPAMLRARGYATAYFHGGDLALDQQHQFLDAVGFEHIREFDPESGLPRQQWGHPDGAMLGVMQDWIDAERRRRPEGAYLASLSTLSSHHPFDAPSTFRAPWPTESLQQRFEASLRYLDGSLGRFYAWFEAHETPKGTILVLTGDHAPLLANKEAVQSGRPLRFDVPLIVVGAGKRTSAITGRLGGHLDIPSTVAGLVGAPGLACGQGLDLFGARWPSKRFVVGVGGRDLDEVHVWDGASEVLFKQRAQELGHLGSGPEATLYEVGGFLRKLLPLNAYVLDKGAYSPRAASGLPSPVALGRVSRPLLVSHRGQTEGVLPLGVANRLDAVKAAAGRGFEWVEVDVNITRDGVPVLVHDRHVVDAVGQKIPVESLTLAQLRDMPSMVGVTTLEALFEGVGDEVNLCIEVKPQLSSRSTFLLAEAVVGLIRRHRASGRRGEVIVDSFGLALATAIKRRCGCEVGLDLPFKAPVSGQWLESIRRSGLDWIYLHASVVSAEVIAEAHRQGIKVMMYTVNEASELERLGFELPDGVITDRWSLGEALGRP